MLDSRERVPRHHERQLAVFPALFEWPVTSNPAGSFGHVAEYHERLLTGVELDNQEAARGGHPKPACS
jgi:hypothetical protein